MALVKAVLSAGFAALPTTTDAQAASNQMAAIYQSYAAAAQAGVALPVFTGSEVVRFGQLLYAVLNIVPGTPANAAGAFVAAMTSFWMTPPVVFGAGVTTAFVGAPILQTALEGVFGAINDKNTFADGMADALDVATKSVTVLIGPTTFNLS